MDTVDIESAYEALLADPRYSKMILSVANDYWRISNRCSSGKSFDDFYASAMIGLWKALKKRDPNQGEAFTKFARNKMRWECADYLRVLMRRSKLGADGIELDDVRDNRPAPCQITEFLPDGDPRLKLLRGYYVEGYTIKQLAKCVGLPRAVVRKNILEALQDSKEYLNGKLTGYSCAG